MTLDPALEAIRLARRQISNEVDNDATRLVERYKQMQRAFPGRVITGPESTPDQPTVKPGQSAPVPDKRSAG